MVDDLTPQQRRNIAAAADIHREHFGDRSRRALVTGHQGFLGRHFFWELKARGYTVEGYDSAVTRAQDCRDLFRLERQHPTLTEANGRWDLVVHCAAVVGGRETIENDPLATAESLSIDAEMFRWAAAVKPKRVIYFSSSAAYPVSLQRAGATYALREGDIGPGLIDPDEVYGWSKVTGERLAFELRRSGVPVTVVRPFSGYGADQSADYPFRAILERVRRREDPLDVWSDAVRDFIHVDDVVRGALAVADSGTEEPVNLCTGLPTSFTALARLMADTAGYSPEIRVLSDKPAGVAYRVGDPERMLGYYMPQVLLPEGVSRALDGG